MREILFRGKDKYKKWIYADYTNERGVIFYDETIGQYIGLKDIDGNKIFEGDIVDILTENEEYGYIKFEDGAFIVVADGFCVDFVNNLHGEDVRVVGNIYDNPEYLNFKIEMMEDMKNATNRC